MSGLAGHLMHLYDDWDLTLGDLKSIVMKLCTNSIPDVSEKVDGINVFITYDVAEPMLYFARNKGDIASGGLIGHEIFSRFCGRPVLGDTFKEAYVALTKALWKVEYADMKRIFGPHRNIWYSTEIVFAKNANVIQYDSNHIVFHMNKSGYYDMSGNRLERDITSNYDALTKVIPALLSNNWQFHTRIPVKLSSANDALGFHAITKIDALMSRSGLSDRNTIGDFMLTMVGRVVDVRHPGLNPATRLNLVRRIMKCSDAPTIVQIVSGMNPLIGEKIRSTNRDATKIIAEATRPIACIIDELGVGILAQAQSSLVSDPAKRIAEMRQSVTASYETMASSFRQEERAFAIDNMNRLGDVDQITSTVEGIVFSIGLKTYKMTGAYAAVNQLTGAVKFKKFG